MLGNIVIRCSWRVLFSLAPQLHIPLFVSRMVYLQHVTKAGLVKAAPRRAQSTVSVDSVTTTMVTASVQEVGRVNSVRNVCCLITVI